jgi:hypothetical protein
MADDNKKPSERPTEEIRAEALGVIDEFLRDRMRWELLRYAVQTAICCPRCGHVLDVRRAGLVETKASTIVGCRGCTETLLSEVKERIGEEKYGKALKAGILEVTIGWDPEMLAIAEEVF